MSSSEHAAEQPTTYNLLFVCTGNTCRSALAGGIARAAVARRGWRHVAIQSAGTGASFGMPASAEAVAVATEQGIDLSGHRSQPLTPALAEWADMILAMGPSHLHTIDALGGGNKASLLTDFIEGEGAGQTIEDPYGSSIDTYRLTHTQLETAIEAMLDRLAVLIAPHAS